MTWFYFTILVQNDKLLDNKRFIVVDVKYKKPLKRPVTLDEIKKQKKFKDWELVRISRLSVMPVPKDIWETILKISQN